MHFVYTERPHANITPKATRAIGNERLKCSEASQHTALVGNLQVQYMGHYLGLIEVCLGQYIHSYAYCYESRSLTYM